MHDLPWARTERTGTDPRPRRTVAELPGAATLRFSARHAGRSMEPTDGAQRHQVDARRHGGACRLRGIPCALNSSADTLPLTRQATKLAHRGWGDVMFSPRFRQARNRTNAGHTAFPQCLRAYNEGHLPADRDGLAEGLC